MIAVSIQVIYQFLSRHLYIGASGELKHRHDGYADNLIKTYLVT